MTKEELKNRAKEFVSEIASGTPQEMDYYANILVEFANVTTKELEKENAELNDKLNNLSSVAAVRLANWQKYEKENKELKAVERMALYSKMSDKLAEAKELIEDIYDLIPSSHSDYYKDVMERARQFLKEEL